MAQLNYPILHDELIADVGVNIPASALIPLRTGGQSSPLILGKGLVDTGSNATGVSQAIIQRLGLFSIAQSSTQGLVGSHAVGIYQVSLHLIDSRTPGLPWFSHPTLVVMELPVNFPYNVLIGMDILLGCRLLVDGPARQFILDF